MHALIWFLVTAFVCTLSVFSQWLAHNAPDWMLSSTRPDSLGDGVSFAFMACGFGSVAVGFFLSYGWQDMKDRNARSE